MKDSPPPAAEQAGSPPRHFGLILKISVFATGLAGIVAEFVLSTLATYLLGNAVLQWTIVMSLMLFAMGLGSRISKSIKKNLLDAFILVEFLLSILCASSAVLAYGLSARTDNLDLIIYALAILIGILIGCEIPLVTRLNNAYEELRTNIATVMEKDYYGALVGGLLFAFFALPRLGLTYTPVALGALNFLIAGGVLLTFRSLIARRFRLVAAFVLCALYLAGLSLAAQPIVLFGEQRQYKDKVVYAEQTPFQKIVITEWKDDYWLYINGQVQFSTVDEERYHEPLVHPALLLAADRSEVLILGGGDGPAVREILKHQDVEAITLVDLDPAMTNLALDHPILLGINDGALRNPKVKVVNGDARQFLAKTKKHFGVIIIDLPDPDSADLMHLYSLGFYKLLKKQLSPGGVMVTQATSPYFARKAFLCLNKTIRAAGFSVLPLHNQIPTMGEWGWVIGVRSSEASEPELKRRLMTLDLDSVPAKFISNEAVISMSHFGRDVFDPKLLAEIEVNTQFKPIILDYYKEGSWGVY